MIDRHYEQMDEDKLLKAHGVLWKAIHHDEDKVNQVRKDMLNLLLEYERELAFREKEQ